MDEARGRFEQALAAHLAAADPANGDWQRELIIVHFRLAATASDAAEETQHITQAASIYRRLEAAGGFQGDAKFAALGAFFAQLGMSCPPSASVADGYTLPLPARSDPALAFLVKPYRLSDGGHGGSHRVQPRLSKLRTGVDQAHHGQGMV